MVQIPAFFQRLAKEFIGSPPQGSNGDVTNLSVPGGIYVRFSGQGVWHADGRQLQRLGLQPAYSCTRRSRESVPVKMKCCNPRLNTCSMVPSNGIDFVIQEFVEDAVSELEGRRQLVDRAHLDYPRELRRGG